MTHLEQFWARIVSSNPGFGQPDDTKVTMSIGAVRKLVAKAHMDGFKGGMQIAKSLEGLGQTSDPTDDLFDLLRKNKP